MKKNLIDYYNKSMKQATLLFLIRRNENKIEEICLAMKKSGFGAGRWNGVGGKVEQEESIEDACKREAFEEVGVKVFDLKKVAELDFIFSKKPEWNQKVHTYFCEKWEGDTTESEEMNPKWFLIKDIPFDSMWPDDIFWLPKVLEEQSVKAEFTFGEDDIIEDQKLSVISSF